VKSLSTQHFENWTGGHWMGVPPKEIEGFNIDTRTLKSGEVFVAIKTERRDGHDFIEAAKALGASAALVSKYQPQVDLPQLVVKDAPSALRELSLQVRIEYSGTVIGVTGSCGKTSTKELLAVLLGEKTLKTQGNFNNRLGVPLTLLQLRAEHLQAVIEVGMSTPGEIASLAKILQPKYSIITTVAPVHLEGVPSLEGVAEEKAALAEASSKLTILPVECFRFSPFTKLKTPCLIAGKPEPGRSYPNGSCFVDFSLDQNERKTDIVLRPKGGSVLSFSVDRTSNGMARNMVLSLLLGLELGLDPHALQTRLESWESTELRCQRDRVGDLDFFIDCYNANPASMRDSLEFFNATTPADRPRFYVLGGMKELGEYTEEYHHELGRSFKLRSVDRLYITGTEMQGFLSGFRVAGRNEEHVRSFSSPSEVSKELRHLEGSVFLKGSRTYALEAIYCQLKELHHPVEAPC
jgi:UDP-N-acetylmuramoyl-tripeptide--D-alanyl-D-alanine ligase